MRAFEISRIMMEDRGSERRSQVTLESTHTYTHTNIASEEEVSEEGAAGE